MSLHVRNLLDRISALEQELSIELHNRDQRMGYRSIGSRAELSAATRQAHRAQRMSAWRWLAGVPLKSFLVLPFIQVPHLASHILGRMAQLLSEEWDRAYGHPIYYLETFVDPERFRGTCYRAANWKVLGLTAGLGKDARSKKPNRSLKEVLGYPLAKNFRTRLCEA